MRNLRLRFVLGARLTPNNELLLWNLGALLVNARSQSELGSLPRPLCLDLRKRVKVTHPLTVPLGGGTKENTSGLISNVSPTVVSKAVSVPLLRSSNGFENIGLVLARGFPEKGPTDERISTGAGPL